MMIMMVLFMVIVMMMVALMAVVIIIAVVTVLMMVMIVVVPLMVVILMVTSCTVDHKGITTNVAKKSLIHRKAKQTKKENTWAEKTTTKLGGNVFVSLHKN